MDRDIKPSPTGALKEATSPLTLPAVPSSASAPPQQDNRDAKYCDGPEVSHYRFEVYHPLPDFRSTVEVTHLGAVLSALNKTDRRSKNYSPQHSLVGDIRRIKQELKRCGYEIEFNGEKRLWVEKNTERVGTR
jgi:hypothetical protein